MFNLETYEVHLPCFLSYPVKPMYFQLVQHDFYSIHDNQIVRGVSADRHTNKLDNIIPVKWTTFCTLPILVMQGPL